MSEAVTKTITGRCEEVSEKNGWTAFAIDVGTQYPVRLSTKLDPLIELGRAASKDGGTFDWTYKESQGGENPHKPGTFYTNRYLEAVAAAGEGQESSERVATPAAAPQGHSERAAAAFTHAAKSAVDPPRSDAMTKEEWARKDSAIHKMACIKTAADALKHTVPSDPTPDDLTKFLDRTYTLALAWHRSVIAERDDPTGESVPFE